MQFRQKIRLKEVGSQITNSDGYVHSDVKIEIDKDRTFNLDTIEVDGKWYVYDESFYDGGIFLVVPEGASIKINNEKISSSYIKDVDLNLTLVHPSSTKKSMSVPGIKTKAYSFEKVLKGSYDITVDGDKVVKDVIYSYSNNRKISSSNYGYELDNGNIIYDFNNKEKNEELYIADSTLVSSAEKYVKSFYDDFVSTLKNSSGFDNMKKYFESDSKTFDTVKNSYEKNSMYIYNKANPYKYTYISGYYYYGNFSNNGVAVKKVYYLNDNIIMAAVDFKLGYTYYSNSSSSNKQSNSNIYSLIQLKKVDNSFVIVDAKDLI